MNSRFDDTARKYREEMLKLYRNSSQFRPEPPAPVPPKQNPPEPPCSKEVQREEIRREEFKREEIKKDFPIRKNTERLPTAPPPDDNEVIAVQGEIYEDSQPDNIPAPNNSNNNIPQSAEEKYPEPVLPPFIFNERSDLENSISGRILTEGENTSSGFLKVNITKGGIIPIENATVTITRMENGNPILVASLKTDRNGNTDTIELPAPALSLSQASDNTQRPYSLYNIVAYKSGFYVVEQLDVPVFSGITSMQPINFIPIPIFNDNN